MSTFLLIWVQLKGAPSGTDEKSEFSISNYREQIDLQWLINLSLASQFTKWASSDESEHFFLSSAAMHWVLSISFILLRFTALVSADDSSDAVCHLWMRWCHTDMRSNRCTVSGHNHSQKQMKPNTGNQRQMRYIWCGNAKQAAVDTHNGINTAPNTHTLTKCAERITNFEYVNKFSVYDTQHNVFRLRALATATQRRRHYRKYFSIVCFRCVPLSGAAWSMAKSDAISAAGVPESGFYRSQNEWTDRMGACAAN